MRRPRGWPVWKAGGTGLTSAAPNLTRCVKRLGSAARRRRTVEGSLPYFLAHVAFPDPYPCLWWLRHVVAGPRKRALARCHRQLPLCRSAGLQASSSAASRHSRLALRMLQQLPGASRKPLARASPIAFCTLLQQWSRAAGPAAGSRRWAARWRGFGFPRHVFGQAAIAAGIIIPGGNSQGSSLRKPATATQASQPQ